MEEGVVESVKDSPPQRVARSATFVHLHIDLFDVLPALSNGARLAVFVCIGLFAADSRGATVEDIVDHTGLSEPTVIKSLRFLEKHGCVGRSARRGDPAGRPYYRALKYWVYRGPPQADVRSTIPPSIAVSAIERSSEKNFSSARKVFSAVAVDINTPPLGNNHQQQQYCAETQKIFAQAHIREPALSRLSERVAPEIAREWCAWLEHAPDEFTNPVGFMVSQLVANPHARPPGQRMRGKRRAWYGEDYAELVNR